MSIFTFYQTDPSHLNASLCSSFDPDAPRLQCLAQLPVSSAAGTSTRIDVPLGLGDTMLATAQDEEGNPQPGNWTQDRVALGLMIHDILHEYAERQYGDDEALTINDWQAIAEDLAEDLPSAIQAATENWTEVLGAEEALTPTHPYDLPETPAIHEDDPCLAHPYRLIASIDHKVTMNITPFTTDGDLVRHAEAMERHHYERHDLALVDAEGCMQVVRQIVRDEDATWGELSPYLLDLVRAGNPALRWKRRDIYNLRNEHIILIRTGPNAHDWEPAVVEESDEAMTQWKKAGLTYPEPMGDKAVHRLADQIGQRANNETTRDAERRRKRLAEEVQMLEKAHDQAHRLLKETKVPLLIQSLERLNGMLLGTAGAMVSHDQQMRLFRSVMGRAALESQCLHDDSLPLMVDPRDTKAWMELSPDMVLTVVDKAIMEVTMPDDLRESATATFERLKATMANLEAPDVF